MGGGGKEFKLNFYNIKGEFNDRDPKVLEFEILITRTIKYIVMGEASL